MARAVIQERGNRQLGMCRREAVVETDGALEQPNRLLQFVLGPVVDQLAPPQVRVISLVIRGLDRGG